MAKPTFAQWREEHNLSIDESATLLGLGRGQICALSRGYDTAGRPILPKTDTLLLMSAVSQGLPLRPWALSPDEIATQRAVRRKRVAAQRHARLPEVA